MIRIGRIYDEPGSQEGRRYFVERLWPRGVRKEDIPAGVWLKEVAPSPELRQWYAHDPSKWEEFKRRYFAELDARPEAWQHLAAAARRGTLTLLYSARDTEHNSALALKEYLERHIEDAGQGRLSKKTSR